MAEYNPDGTPSPLECHRYQRTTLKALFSEGDNILNVASKEDPAFLGRDFGALNVDQQDYDPQEQMSLYGVPNFTKASALNLPFGDSHFHHVIIGELLEHCPLEAAVKILKEAIRVMRPDGNIIVTYPLDNRPAEEQHAPEHLITWEAGITSWHQTVWEENLFQELLDATGLCNVKSFEQTLRYPMGCGGRGRVLQLQGSESAVETSTEMLAFKEPVTGEAKEYEFGDRNDEPLALDEGASDDNDDTEDDS